MAEYTSYNWNNQRLGLKVKYRFKDLYTGKHNELRLAQDYSLVIPITETLGFGQKFSVEERIRDRFSLRPRYRAVVEKELSETTNIGLNGEMLLNFGPEELPVFEYRFSGFVEFLIFSNLSATLGAQFRYEDFTRDATDEIFIISGFDLRI